MNLLYRADAGQSVGTGHLLRASRLLCELRSSAPLRARLLFHDNPVACRLASESGFDLRPLASRRAPTGLKPILEAEPILRELDREPADLVIVDMLDTRAREMAALKRTGVPLMTLDDRGDGRAMADAIVNCLVTEPRPPALPKPERLFEGPAYAVLDAVYAASRGSCRPSPGRAVSRVLVTLGGVDSEGLCAKAALALQRVTGIERLVFACGKDYAHLAALKDACLGAAWKSEFRLGEPSLLPLYRDTDMAIVAGGLTMHEVCCVGLPAIALCQRVDHQEELAIRFARDGAMVAAGVGREISDDRLVYVLQSVISNPDQRGRLAQRGPQLVDGRGASRVASIALALAEGKDPPREHAI